MSDPQARRESTDPLLAMPASEAIARAEKLIVSTIYRGIELRMAGDKTLVGLKIAPEIIAEGQIEDLEEALKQGVHRARLIADYQAAWRFAELTEIEELLKEGANPPRGFVEEVRSMPVPELNAAILSLLERRSWSLADLAERSQIEPRILEELMVGTYRPFEATKGDKTLAGVIDLTVPIARAFGVSPWQLWTAGRARMAAHQRAQRYRLKRILAGSKRCRKRRKQDRSKLANLRLGDLMQAGVMCERELELRIELENLHEISQRRPKWLPVKRRQWKDAEESGSLLGPNGEILRESVTNQEVRKLMDLDERAEADPGSINDEELERARDLVGIPTLEVGSATDS